MTEIFVTGGSGFVGGAAIVRFIKEGHSVRAMSRSERSDKALEGLGAEPVRCDLEDVAAGHMSGSEIVVHSAAYVESWGPKDAWDKINVGGTKRMLTAAKDAGVKRFIHIGTEAALIHGQALNDADETNPLALKSPYPYCRTKAWAEKVVRDANDVGGLETIVLRPRFIWGPGDATILPLVKKMSVDDSWMWINHGKAMTSTTHVYNLVEGIVLAFTKGTPGEPYFILDDGRVTLHEIISRLADTQDVALSDRSLPLWLAETIGWSLETIWRLFGLKSEPALTRHAVMVMSRDCTLIGDKARRELGYRPIVTLDDGMTALKAISQAGAGA